MSVISVPYAGSTPRPELEATSGGRGSFSYADTKVYGPRQSSQYWITARRAWDPLTGLLISELLVPTTKLIVPGTGGGAKAPGKRNYGSQAVGFKPQGLVLIRLLKLD